MRCLDENEALELLEGLLGPEAIGRIDAHIAGCAACRELVATLARTRAAIPVDTGATTQLAAPIRPKTSLAPGQRIDHFRVVDRLGAGGMGEVYLAEDTQLQRNVALKIIHPRLVPDPRDVDRLLREARATARFSHPNIVTIYHVGTHDEAPYLALEHLDGETLRERMRRRGALPAPEVAAIGLALAEALREAHHHGVLHCDLKPENVMLADDRPRVLDFGLSALHAPLEPCPVREAGSSDERSTVTHRSVQQSVRGTPAYMAPEQWRGEAVEASDIWALGVMLFELAAGRRPFSTVARSGVQDHDLANLRQQVLDDRATPQLDLESRAPVPQALRTLCSDCLQKEPRRRPTAVQVVKTLGGLVQAEQVSSPGRVLGYILVLLAILFVFAGVVLCGGASMVRSGEAAELVAGLVLTALGLGHVVVGGVLLRLGLRRRPGGLFAIVLGALLTTPAVLVQVVSLDDLLKGSQDALDTFTTGYIVFAFGLVSLLGVVLIVHGVKALAHRRALKGAR